MGKFKNAVFNAADRMTAGSVVSKKRFLLSIVSLILATMVLATSTYCWLAMNTSSGHIDEMGLVTDVGLRSNDVGESFKNLTDNACLLPASSVDGRNLYFPSDGTDFSSDTGSITYRTANTGDKNYGYLQYDFELMAEANYTSIYIDGDPAKTNIGIRVNTGDSDAEVLRKQNLSKAIRVAFYYDGMPNNKPILFNTQNKTTENMAVDQVDRTDGSLMSTAKQKASPFRDYTYGKTPLAMLDQGEKRRFSLLVWLEGTDENCTDDLAGEKIDFKLAFTTSWDNKARITFEDNAAGQVNTLLNSNNSYALVLNYNDEEHHINNSKFTMYKDAEATTQSGRNCWYCYIPDNASHDISFMVVNSDNQIITTGGVTYQWTNNLNNESTLYRMDATKYINDGTVSTGVRGHWYDGDIEDKGNGSDNGGIIDFDDDW